MSVSHSAEQREFRRVVRSFFEAKSPEAVVRETMVGERGFDPELWALLADQTAVQGLTIPEEFGGTGFTFVETAIVLEEAGRALLCEPLLATTIATMAILGSGDHIAMKQWLPRIASGATIATVASIDESTSADRREVTTCASPTDDGWLVDGVKAYVVDGEAATLMLVVAQTDDDYGLFAVDPTNPAVRRTRMIGIDETRRLARVEMRGVPAERVGGRFDVGGLDRVATVALACEQVGVAERALEMAVEYAKHRIQFGRPIGSFQAVKHMCADMMAGVEAMRAAALVAARAVADGSSDLPEIAAIAGSVCSEICRDVARTNIQVHGAIAFTWEYPAHLYFKRAIADELLFGDPASHREQLARAIGL